MAALPSRLPMTEDGAIALADRFRREDPFKDTIPESLLSAEHVQKYVAATGMLWPFYPGNLKSASYEAFIEGKVIWWKSETERKEIDVRRGEQSFIELEPNSITFVQVEPHFRLPNYIAVRFNLRITHVHRGLLLGTGPLVDPGFEGRLLIPLHNLTASSYRLDLSKALIWLELTKTSYVPAAEEDEHSFPADHNDISADRYLWKASAGAPIISSIPKAVQDASHRAAQAEKDARSSAKNLSTVRNIGIVAVLTGVAGVTAALFQSLSIDNTLADKVTGLHQALETMQKDLGGTAARATNTEAQLADLAKLRADLAAAQQQIAALQSQVNELRHAPAPAQSHP